MATMFTPSGAGQALRCDRYYKRPDTANFYEHLLSCLHSSAPRISCPGADRDTVNDVLHQILLDHPDLCHFEGKWHFDGDVLPQYTLTQEQRDKLAAVVAQAARAISDSCPEGAARVQSACTWLASHTQYDPDAPHSQSAYGALVEGRAVCKGLAKALQLLLRNMGIPCILVEGSLDGMEKHIWNQYFLDGKWLHCDVIMYYPKLSNLIAPEGIDGYWAMETGQLSATHRIFHPEQLPDAPRDHFFQTLDKSRQENGSAAPAPLPKRFRSKISGSLLHIASGSVSQVFQTSWDGTAAVIKQIRCGLDMSKLYHAMRECAMNQLVRSCPGVVPMLEYDVQREKEGFTVFLVQEYRMPLDEYCARTPMTLHTALRLTQELCITLQECRKAGVAHLDIQPGNLFVDASGSAILGDFSSALPMEEVGQLHHVRGTPAYLAPEVANQAQYSEASEVYALGMVLYSLLHDGQIPFASSGSVKAATERRLSGEPFQLSSALPPDVALCLKSVFAFDPGRRCPTLHDFQLQLEELLEDCQEIQLPAGFQTSNEPRHSSSWDYSMNTSCIVPPKFSRPDSESCSNPCATTEDFRQRAWSTTRSLSTSLEADSYGASITLCGTVPPPAVPFLPMESVFSPGVPPMNADDYASSVALCLTAAPSPEPEPDPIRVDQVQFSAVAPQSAIKGEYTLVQLYMYEQAFRSAVEEALQMGDGPMQEKKSGLFKVEDQTRVRVVLSSTDVQIPDDTLEEVWSGGYLCFDFAFEIPMDFAKRQILLKATVYFNGIPATRLLLPLKTQSLREQKLEMIREDVLSAFISYASQDRNRVAGLVQGMRKVRPEMKIFFDINSLRSGENWEAALYSQIEGSDTLFLCWSVNAKASAWVDREWRYALAQKGLEAIEPVPLDPPELCPPPPELSSKHFNDGLLYIINR